MGYFACAQYDVLFASSFTIYRQSAIIVHELTHYFAYLNEIFFETESEKCTDILAIFLGFYPMPDKNNTNRGLTSCF